MHLETMHPKTRLVPPSYASLGLMFVGTILLQILLPFLAWTMGAEFPEVKNLSLPYSIAAVAAILVIQVGLVAVGALISAYARGKIFEQYVLRWVDLLCGCVFLAPCIAMLTTGHLLFVVNVGGSGVLLMFFAFCVLTLGCTSLALLLRRVYLDSRADHVELEGVI